MHGIRIERAETATEVVPEGRRDETKQSWKKPALEKLPLSEARTGTADGSSDSELYS